MSIVNTNTPGEGEQPEPSNPVPENQEASQTAQPQAPVQEDASVPPTEEALRQHPPLTRRHNDNVHLEHPATTTYEGETPKEIKAGDEVVPFISHTRDYVLENIDNNNEESQRIDNPAARRWFQVADAGLGSLQIGMQFEETFKRPGSEFRQTLMTEKGPLGFGSPRFNDSESRPVSGERGVLRVRALLGLGSLISIPLWHSGFHVTIKTPKDSALIELRRRVMESKISLGRDTHGLAFSNTSSYIAGWLLDFVVDHIFETSLKNSNDIRKRIQTPDLPVLFWGLACTIWPNGFHYVRSVATPQGIDNKEVVSGKINVGKLMWVDNTAFTKHQKAHMTSRTSGTMTDESITRYLEDFDLFKGRTVSIRNGLDINLRIPGADEYVRSGNQWISALAEIVESIFTDDREDVERRNIAIAEHANATIMRQYGHWVGGIVIDGVEQTDRETIDGSLEVMSEDTEVRKIFHEAVTKYIDDVTVAVIAIPEVSNVGTELERFPNLIPIDVIAVFFTLLMQRVNQIMTR